MVDLTFVPFEHAPPKPLEKCWYEPKGKTMNDYEWGAFDKINEWHDRIENRKANV